MVAFKNTQFTSELAQILTLQAQNIPVALSDEEQKTQGFVTVQHDLPLLQSMAATYGHTVAIDDGRLAGYALVMLPEFRSKVKLLQPMFDKLNYLMYRGKTVSAYNYFVMGQICVAYQYRGKGVFSGLYQQLKASMSPWFEVVVTEVAVRNERSLRAHKKMGFRVLETYVAPDGEVWKILLWELSHHH